MMIEELYEFESVISELRSDLKLMKWMLGTVLAVVLALLYKAL